MQLFELRGIAEGLAGQSSIHATSFEDILNRLPQLRSIQDKLQVNGNVVSGFTPCDG